MNRLGLLLAGAALFVLAGPAVAQPAQCGFRAVIQKHLVEKYNEMPERIGVMPNGNVLEIWASEETGTFTVMVSDPAGSSCVMATGDGWQTPKPVVVGPDA